MYIVKTESYDKFQCIADRCPFTCCKGWEIKVDPDTLAKWKNDGQQLLSLFPKADRDKHSKKEEYHIKFGSDGSCPFLDTEGLCRVVTGYGEDYQPAVCRTFPRQENCLAGRKEYSLSCTCPAVIDIINETNESLKFVSEGGMASLGDTLPELKIRQAMTGIMQQESFSLKDRLLLIFYMLLLAEKEPAITEETIDRYQDKEYLRSIADLWSGAEAEASDSFSETNELFLDMVCNYRKEKSYSRYLKNIALQAEKPIRKESMEAWREYKAAFHKFDLLLENCIVSKIFADCVNSNLKEIILSYQMIITEYIMVRYSSFLKNTLDYEEVRDFIAVYSRIIEYNAAGMKEFWEDSFDEAIWEFGYLLLLIG